VKDHFAGKFRASEFLLKPGQFQEQIPNEVPDGGIHGGARAGINAKLPQLDSWPNQFPGCRILTRFPEYVSVCPKAGLPDYGTIISECELKKARLE
jgi:hypothetical protein